MSVKILLFYIYTNSHRKFWHFSVNEESTAVCYTARFFYLFKEIMIPKWRQLLVSEHSMQATTTGKNVFKEEEKEMVKNTVRSRSKWNMWQPMVCWTRVVMTKLAGQILWNEWIELGGVQRLWLYTVLFTSNNWGGRERSLNFTLVMDLSDTTVKFIRSRGLKQHQCRIF